MKWAVLLCIAALGFAWYYQNWKLVGGAIALLALALLIPVVFRPLTYLWMVLGLLSQKLVSKLILILLYLFLVIPIGMIRKYLGKDTLNLKRFKKTRQSVFKLRNHQYEPNDLEYPF